MLYKRSRATSVINKDGNLWVIGGTADNKAVKSTEAYEYKPLGRGAWGPGPQLPIDYRYTGIESHCTVR